jgi:lambda family phage tail tape measure protein
MTAAESSDAIEKANADAANSLAALIPQIEAFGGQGIAVAEALRASVAQMADDGASDFSALGSAMTDAFADPFADFITGAASAEDAMASLADSIISQMAKIAAQSVATNLIAPLVGQIFGGAAVPVASAKGNVIPFAKGGLPGIQSFENAIVSVPTMFGFGGNVGVMGEAGKEAIMPLEHSMGFGVRSSAGGVLPVERMLDGALGVHVPQFADGAVFGGGAPSSGGSGGGNLYLTVQPAPGQDPPQITQKTEGNDTIMGMIFSGIEGQLANRVAGGKGPLAAAMEQAYGVRKTGR